jgi:hypothetical protein
MVNTQQYLDENYLKFYHYPASLYNTYKYFESRSWQGVLDTILCIHVNLPTGAFLSRFWGSLPSTFKIFRPWKKSSTKKSWPTFCDQYFWKFPISNSRAEEKRREIQMVKVNVIFNDIRLLICLTPLQVNWFM